MRGFLAVFGLAASAPDALESKLGPGFRAWKNRFPAAGFSVERLGPFSLYRFSGNGTGYDSNQTWALSQDGSQAVFSTGPRVGLCEDPDTTVVFRFDAIAGGLQVKTDLLNSTFIYHTVLRGSLLFSDSSLALAEIAGAGIDPVAAAEFLCGGWILDGKSLYQGITRLPPASWLPWDREGKCQAQEYWRMSDIAFASLRLRDALPMVTEALEADFRKLAASGRKFIVDLTGGYDSRCNFGFARNSGLVFTALVTGSHDNEDVLIAKRIAAKCAVPIAHGVPGSQPFSEEDLIASGQYVDFESDIVAYAEALRVNRIYCGSSAGVNGSIADVVRNFFLSPSYCASGPGGGLLYAPLIKARFPAAGDPLRWLRPEHAFAWGPHMQAALARADFPGLPAYARLDAIFLRMTAQNAAGRIASSHNRLIANFTPWAKAAVLGPILATRWQDKAGAKLSLALLSHCGGGLDAYAMIRGTAPGTGALSALKSLPHAGRYQIRRAANKLSRSLGLRRAEGAYPYARNVHSGLAYVEDLLHPLLTDYIHRRGPEVLPVLTGATHPLLNRLLTLIAARKFLGS